MLLLIDGYNLLNATDLFPPAEGAPTLARAREALLTFLAKALPTKVRDRTKVVFDAAMAPPGLPRELTWEGISVVFAPRKATADDVLEDLIASAADPRHLLVVSSDHRVQRAARQKGAESIDSEKWYVTMRSRLRSELSASALAERQNDDGKPNAAATNPFPPGYAADVASEEWRPAPRRGRGRKS